MAKRRLAMTVAVLAMLAGGVTAAAAGGRGGPEIKAVEPVPIVDDSNPPAVPPAKAVKDPDLSRDGSAAEPHTGHGDPGGDDRVDWATDPNAWVCVGPNDVGHARIVEHPSLKILESMRTYVVERRTADPAWMPVVEYDAAPAGCKPIEGKPSLEDFYRDRTVLAVLNDDGSIKSVAELADQEQGS